MSIGAFGENFPYSNFHDLNLDWVIKIAKDFLDQYTEIQNIIDSGKTSIEELTESELASLETWYNEHQDYLNQYLTDSIQTFNTSADAKAEQTIASIPSDYTALSNKVASMDTELAYLEGKIYRKKTLDNFIQGKFVDLENGQEYDIAGYSTTPYIPISTRITTTAKQHSHGCVAFYNANYGYVGYTVDYDNIIPAKDSAYFRVVNYTAEQANPTVTLYDYSIAEIRTALFSKNPFLTFEAYHTGFFVDYATGAVLVNSNYKCSDYIDIQGSKPIIEAYFYSDQAGFAFYDENLHFISGFNTYNYTLPSNAKYILFSVHAENTGKLYLPVTMYPFISNPVTFTPSIQGYIDVVEPLDLGSFHVVDKYKSTDFIPVPYAMTTTCVQNSQGGLAFYDANFQYIAGTRNYKNIVIPKDAVYFRICDYNSNNQQTGTITCYYEFPHIDNPLYHKKLTFVGDSLTGVYYKNADEVWTYLIANRNDATQVNLGLSGSPIAQTGSYENPPICNRLDSIPADSDYIMIMGGTNDFNLNVPIGNNTDTNKTTFKGALNYIINYLITNFPNAKILFATTYRRNESRNDEPYATAMIDICRLQNIPCVDNYHSSGVHFFNEAWMTVNGAWTWTGDASEKMTNRHLNKNGDYLVSYHFENALKGI